MNPFTLLMRFVRWLWAALAGTSSSTTHPVIVAQKRSAPSGRAVGRSMLERLRRKPQPRARHKLARSTWCRRGVQFYRGDSMGKIRRDERRVARPKPAEPIHACLVFRVGTTRLAQYFTRGGNRCIAVVRGFAPDGRVILQRRDHPHGPLFRARLPAH